MINVAHSIRTLAWSLLPAVAIPLALGCSATMNGDNAGSQMNSGLSEARSGLAQTQSGTNAMNTGARQAGMADISTGMTMMNQGVTDMHDGMAMMSGNMMMNCSNGGSDAVLGPMHQAMDEMQKGQAMFADDAGSGDAEGMTHMQNGMSMMKSALDQAQNTTNCMGHNGMMSGGSMSGGMM